MNERGLAAMPRRRFPIAENLDRFGPVRESSFRGDPVARACCSGLGREKRERREEEMGDRVVVKLHSH